MIAAVVQVFNEEPTEAEVIEDKEDKYMMMKPLRATLGLFFYSLTFIILFITTSPALTVISLEINFFHMLTPEVIEVFFLFIIIH